MEVLGADPGVSGGAFVLEMAPLPVVPTYSRGLGIVVISYVQCGKA